MLTETTGPALATDHLARSVQALRDGACARPRRGGWREAFAPVAAADAACMAIVALLDALLRLLHEFSAARARGDVVAAGLAPSRADAAGVNMLDDDAAELAGLPCEPESADAASHAARARRAPASRLAPVAVPAIAPTSPAPRASTARPSPHAAGSRPPARRVSPQVAGSRRVAPGRSRLLRRA